MQRSESGARSATSGLSLRPAKNERYGAAHVEPVSGYPQAGELDRLLVVERTLFDPAFDFRGAVRVKVRKNSPWIILRHSEMSGTIAVVETDANELPKKTHGGLSRCYQPKRLRIAAAETGRQRDCRPSESVPSRLGRAEIVHIG
jgi:hypothetical protein